MRSSRGRLRALARNGLIGLDIRVARASERALEGLEGTVLDETLRALVVEAAGKRFSIEKSKVSLVVSFPEGDAVLEGKDLLHRPEDRLKKLWRKIR